MNILSVFFSPFGQDDLCEFQEHRELLFWLKVSIILSPKVKKKTPKYLHYQELSGGGVNTRC